MSFFFLSLFAPLPLPPSSDELDVEEGDDDYDNFMDAKFEGPPIFDSDEGEMNYGFAYEVDEDGEPVDDDDRGQAARGEKRAPHELSLASSSTKASMPPSSGAVGSATMRSTPSSA